MNIARTLGLAFMGLLIVGCTYHRQASMPAPGLPEEIFATPMVSGAAAWNVAVFPFRSPDYAPEQGVAAARHLSQALFRSGGFGRITPVLEVTDLRLDNLVRIAGRIGCHAIVVGDLTTYFEGSRRTPSRVVQQVQVIRVQGVRPQLMWHARATEIGLPAADTDYYVALGAGVPAPPADLLLQRNAEKFSNLFLHFPRRTPSLGALAVPGGKPI
jgi:hypothetical protein